MEREGGRWVGRVVGEEWYDQCTCILSRKASVLFSTY